MPKPFLTAIAEGYIARYQDISNFLYVFPSRRAGTFFLKRLVEAGKGADMLLPKVTTMTDFVETITGKVIGSRIELLLILYESYAEILRENGSEKVPEFDAFRRWGETALSDFNEVDMQDVDAEAIFKNVKDLKEISSNFLTEEQMQVMNEFFGQAYDPEQSVTEFWKKFNKDENNQLHARFRLLWQVLGPLYVRFKSKLDRKDLSTTGGAYRQAADILKEGYPDLLDADKIVMVGFNALTSSERKIFDGLQKLKNGETGEEYAEFFWDATGPVINDKGSAAGRYVQYNRNRWPSPEWSAKYLEESEEKSMPEHIKVISVPSNSMQTKVISDVLAEMESKLPEEDFSEAKVAVVLPDEQLLIPMLYSLPDSLKEVNLTMGYPLKLAAVTTFVSLLRRLETNRRKTGDRTGYYYKDLNTLLSHPFSRVLFGNDVTRVKDWISKHHRFIVDIADVRAISAEMASLLRPLGDDAGVEETAGWLDRILKKILESLPEDKTVSVKNNVDAANICVYRRALSQMLGVAKEYGINMKWRTFLMLTDRLVSGETVNFEGQPLKGLQVMGILETRALDFDRIIIPSLNERILPAKRRPRTFISESLRKAYGLPPVSYSESLYAYYFYRMISRAREVVLLYDSRTSEGARSGDVSRYVLQLEYLYARGKMETESRTFAMSKSELRPSPIEKTPEMIDTLATYLDGRKDGSNLSATALTKYVDCQLKFYYEHILKIKTDEESTEYIDSITQGSVVHDVMQNIYLPEDKQQRYLKHPELIDAALIKARIKDTKYIDDMIRRSINTRFFRLDKKDIDRPLRGSSVHVARILRNQVLSILRFDLAQAPFLLYGVEMDGNVSLLMRDGRKVNMRYAIDRLDECRINGENRMRIVDYKTGTVHSEGTSMADVFHGEYKGKNLLQLWLYANLFEALPDKNFDKNGERPVLDLFGEGKQEQTPLVLEFYDVSRVSKGEHVYPKINGVYQTEHTEENENFLSNLEETLENMFDPEVPFYPAENETSCSYCAFKTICWR